MLLETDYEPLMSFHRVRRFKVQSLINSHIQKSCDTDPETGFMQMALHMNRTVQPGDKVEFTSPELEGSPLTWSCCTSRHTSERRSVVDILDEAALRALASSKTAEEL